MKTINTNTTIPEAIAIYCEHLETQSPMISTSHHTLAQCFALHGQQRFMKALDAHFAAIAADVLTITLSIDVIGRCWVAEYSDDLNNDKLPLPFTAEAPFSMVRECLEKRNEGENVKFVKA